MQYVLVNKRKDPCSSKPCLAIRNTVPESCFRFGPNSFQCRCKTGFSWIDKDFMCVRKPKGYLIISLNKL